MDAAFWVLGPALYMDLHMIDPLCPAMDQVTDSVTAVCTAEVFSTEEFTILVKTLVDRINTVLVMLKTVVATSFPAIEAAIFNSTSGIDITMSLNQTSARDGGEATCEYLQRLREMATLLFVGALICLFAACAAMHYLLAYTDLKMLFGSTDLTKGVPRGAIRCTALLCGGYLVLYLGVVVIYPAVHAVQLLPMQILRAITIPPSPPPMPPMPPPPASPPSPPNEPAGWGWSGVPISVPSMASSC